MYKIVIFACCCLVLACQAASIIRPLKEKMEKQYNCQLDNVDIDLCKRVMNNTFLQQSYAGLRLKSEDDLILANNDLLRDLPFNLLRHASYYWMHHRVEDRSLSPFADFIDFKQNRIPQYILQKRCLSRHCFLLSTANHAFYRQNDMYDSVEITIQVPVLFREIASNSLTKALEDVVVGCTCVIPL